MKKLVIILTILCSGLVVLAQSDSTTFSNEQVLRISNKIKDLEQTDSLRSILVTELNHQIQELKDYQRRDSLLIDFKNQELVLREKEVELYMDLAKLNKPKWHENKYIWFGLGMASVITSSWVVANTIP
jgi:hypothetical protein